MTGVQTCALPISVSCTGSIRYRALNEQEPSPPGPPGGGIVRVEAHPECKPVVRPPSTDGSGSWRWKPPEQRGSLRQSTFELNDLNRDSESDGYPGSVDGRRSVTGMDTGSEHGGGGGQQQYQPYPPSHPHVVHPLHPHHPHHHPPDRKSTRLNSSH